MQNSISTAVQQGGSLFRLLCVTVSTIKRALNTGNLINIIAFKLSPLSHGACFCLGVLQVMQNVSLRAAFQAAYLSLYIGIVNVVFSQAGCDISLSALHWQSFIHKSLGLTMVLQVKQLLLLFPHKSQVCTQEERERERGGVEPWAPVDLQLQLIMLSMRLDPRLLFFSFLPLSF